MQTGGNRNFPESVLKTSTNYKEKAFGAKN